MTAAEHKASIQMQLAQATINTLVENCATLAAERDQAHAELAALKTPKDKPQPA